MTNTFIFTNNAVTTLGSSLASGATSATLAAGTGTLFPSPAAGQQFSITITPASGATAPEIAYCTARSGDTLTIVRGQESTAATNWSVGDVVTCQLTAGQMAAMLQTAGLPVVNPLPYGADSGAANAIVVTCSPAPAALAAGLAVMVKVNNNNTGATTANVNGLGAKAVYFQGAPLAAGSVSSGVSSLFAYNGTRWELLGPGPQNRTVYGGPFYVNASTGNDSNSGLSSGTAWLTLQHAVTTVLHTYDLGGATATINITGAFTAGFTVNAPWVGGAVIIDGGSASTASITCASTSCCISNYGNFTIQNVTISAPGAGKAGLVATENGVINLGNGLVFGQCGQEQMLASFGGTISAFGSSFACTSVGGNSPVCASASGGNIVISGCTITLTSTPAFATAFLQAQGPGTVWCNTLTFVGTGTGPGWSAAYNGYIDTQGTQSNITGAGFSSGSTSNGGQVS